MTYAEAMAQLRHGQARPPLRPRDRGRDRADTRDSQFGVFASAPVVRYLVAPRAFSRAELGRLEEIAKEWGAKGLAYLVNDESARSARRSRSSSRRTSWTRSRAEPGNDGALRRRRRGDGRARARRPARRTSARELEPRRRGARSAFHWVIDFPLFERDEDTGQLDVPPPSVHRARCRATRTGSSPTRARRSSQHYDLIWNGWELGSRLDPDPPRRDPGSASSGVMGISERGAAGEVRLPARRPPDGRAAARRLRDGHRPLRRPHGRRAGHPPGDRVPEGLERGRPADRGADPDARFRSSRELGIRVDRRVRRSSAGT